jgi:hypothetical protein
MLVQKTQRKNLKLAYLERASIRADYTVVGVSKLSPDNIRLQSNKVKQIYNLFYLKLQKTNPHGGNSLYLTENQR